MRVRPSIPLQLQAAAGGDLDGGLGWCGAFVTDYVRVGVVIWEDEAVVLVLGDGPACYDGCGVLAGEGGRVALVAA